VKFSLDPTHPYYPFGKGPRQHIIRCLKNKKCEDKRILKSRWGGGAVDGGSVNAVLASALMRVMRVVVPIPVVTSGSVLHSATVGGSVVCVVRPL